MKLTKKDLRNHFDYIIKAGYCEYQTLIGQNYKVFSNYGFGSGIYGWNWTAFKFYTPKCRRVVICTGYRDMIGENIKGIEKFEQKANDISYNFDISYEDRQKQQEENVQEFLKFIDEQIDLGNL